MEREFIDLIKELSTSSSGFALVLWAAFLLKRYVINGNLQKFWNYKERECLTLESLSKKLDSVIVLQERLNSHVKESEEWPHISRVCR